MITITFGTDFGQNSRALIFGNTENNKNIRLKLTDKDVLTMPYYGKSYEKEEFLKLLDLLKDMVENPISTVEF